MRQLSIFINDIELKASLLDTSTADAIYNILPIKGRTSKWGDEIYFEIPVNLGEEAEASEEVEVGDLAFWPVGSALCIFFGRTPVSTDDKPRAYSPVNVFGKIEGKLDALKQVKPNTKILVRK